MYSMHLENCFENIEIVLKTNGKDAITYLKESSDEIDVVLCDYNMPQANGGVVFRFIRDQKIEVPFILFSTELMTNHKDFIDAKSDDVKFGSMVKPLGGSEFKSEFIEIYNSLSVEKTKSLSVEGYQRIRSIYFLRYNKTLCDIFIQLNPQKYLKIINADSEYTRSEIEKFVKKKQEFFHVKTEDYQRFCDFTQSTDFLIFNEDLSGINLDEAIGQTVEIVHHLVLTIGFTPRTLEIVDTAIGKISKEVKKNNQLGQLLGRLRSKKNYLHEHCYILAYLCDVVCSKMGWTTSNIKEKLYYASLLHDITLEDNDMVVGVELNNRSVEDYGTESAKVYLEHQDDAAKLIRAIDELPPNVDLIIQNHNERPDGKGFPRKISSTQVTPLEAVFIIGNAFVIELYKCDFNKEQIPDILGVMSNVFSTGNYKKPFEAFVSVSRDYLYKSS